MNLIARQDRALLAGLVIAMAVVFARRLQQLPHLTDTDEAWVMTRSENQWQLPETPFEGARHVADALRVDLTETKIARKDLTIAVPASFGVPQRDLKRTTSRLSSLGPAPPCTAPRIRDATASAATPSLESPDS